MPQFWLMLYDAMDTPTCGSIAHISIDITSSLLAAGICAGRRSIITLMSDDL